MLYFSDEQKTALKRASGIYEASRFENRPATVPEGVERDKDGGISQERPQFPDQRSAIAEGIQKANEAIHRPGNTGDDNGCNQP